MPHLAFILYALLFVSFVQAAQPPAQPRPAEEIRLSNTVFREGLRQRGLTGILERHLADFPPDNTIDALLALRGVRLAERVDPGLSNEERHRATSEANDILEQLIAGNPSDLRRFTWRFDLAHSLLFDQADRYVTNILYYGGSHSDRDSLRALSTRAVNALLAFEDDLNREYERLDHLTIEEFARLESDNYIENLDRLAPRAAYLTLWAYLYDALPRSDTDGTRAQRLHQILGQLATDSTFLGTPHAQSGVQIQAMVLAGMTHRLLNRHRNAAEFFDRALLLADQLSDSSERLRIGWAVTLAWVERIRNNVEDQRHDEALANLKQLRDVIASEYGGNFGLRLVAALLERSIHRDRAVAAKHDGHVADESGLRRLAWTAVDNLARQEPDRRDRIYATLYEQIDPNVDVMQLDPFERCAHLAGLLGDAGRADDPDPLLDLAIQAGERFLTDVAGDAKSLVPEVLFNTGTAYYRRGRLSQSVEKFLRVATQHTNCDIALRSATLAVQVGAELHALAEFRNHPEVQALYRDALHTIVSRYADSEAAKYWQFYYAQLLDELEEHHLAAIEYAQVKPAHDNYFEAAASRARCLANVVQRLARDESSDLVELKQMTADFFAARRAFVALANMEANRADDSEQRRLAVRMLAESFVTAAEVQILPHENRAADALHTLTGFEERYPDSSSLTGRIWRVRLIALGQLGRLDEAGETIPAFVSADPKNAGPTLQTIYVELADRADELRREGDSQAAQRKTEMALVVARHIQAWAHRDDAMLTQLNRRAIALQLAEAHLNAGQYDRARDLFAPMLRSEIAITRDAAPSELRVVVGYAEALFQLNDYEGALPWFNKVAMALPSNDPARWNSLLRDLQCRTRLNHPPQGIIKVIEQQKYLHEDLGSPALTESFNKLVRENQRRLDGG